MIILINYSAGDYRERAVSPPLRLLTAERTGARWCLSARRGALITRPINSGLIISLKLAKATPAGVWFMLRICF